MASSVISEDPFRSHLIVLLSTYELRPSTAATAPKYTGPSNWQTDAILRSLNKLFKRFTGAEANGSDTDSATTPKPTSQTSLIDDNATITPPSKARNSAPTSIDLPDSALRDVPSFFHKNSFGVPVNLAGTASAPATAYAEYIVCPTCNARVLDYATISKIASFGAKVSPGSPSVVATGGPLDTAARESGMNAVDELRLLKAQVQDVARVCNAVAQGDLSQKITVEVRSVVMVRLKDAINTMVFIPYSPSS